MVVKSGLLKVASLVPATIALSGFVSVAAAQSAPQMRTVVTSVGVSHQEPAVPEEPPFVLGVSSSEVSATEAAFRDLQVLAETHDARPGVNEEMASRIWRSRSQLALQRLQIYPADIDGFAVGVKQMLDEEHAVIGREAAAMCARKSELVTASMFEAAEQQMHSNIATWRVRRVSGVQRDALAGRQGAKGCDAGGAAGRQESHLHLVQFDREERSHRVPDRLPVSGMA